MMPEVSYHQQQYIRHQKKEKKLVLFLQIFILLLFLVLWEISARTGLIDSFIFSSPMMIWHSFCSMCRDGSVFPHLSVTITETLVSFLFVVILGAGMAVLLWTCPRLAKITEPYLVVLNSLPKSALAPLLIVWLGANERTIIVCGMSVAIFGSILNLYTGFSEAETDRKAGWRKERKTYEDYSSIFCAVTAQRHESKHWSVSGRCHHRRIYRCQERTWLSDHLLQPDL